MIKTSSLEEVKQNNKYSAAIICITDIYIQITKLIRKLLKS